MKNSDLSKLAEALDIAARQHNQSAAACREAAAVIGGMLPKEPVNADPIEAAVDAYLEDYEYGETCYCPTPTERAIAKDAIMGLLEDDGFLQAVDSLPDDEPAREVSLSEAEAKFAQWWSANYSGMHVSLDGNYHAGRVLRAVLRSMGLPS